MPSINIVTHCWAVKKPLYATLLRAQLSSLVLNPPGVEVDTIVCYDPDDNRTAEVINDFTDLISVLHMPFTAPQMWRRAIGRHAASQVKGQYDLVWFTDCDYLFGPDCLRTLFTQWYDHEEPDMIWPKGYLAHDDKAPIDEFCRTMSETRGILTPPLGDCTFQKCNRAIGGLQCVSGAYARQHGYLPNSKWQIEPDRPFPDFRDDIAFRKSVYQNGRVIALDELTGFFRLRHTDVGYGS